MTSSLSHVQSDGDQSLAKNRSKSSSREKQRQYAKARKARKARKKSQKTMSEKLPPKQQHPLNNAIGVVTGDRIHPAWYVGAPISVFSQSLAVPSDRPIREHWAAAYEDASDLLQSMQQALMRSSSELVNCVIFDIHDLQFKCHAPKEGNPNIAFEFYGTNPSDCFGFGYTFEEAHQILVGFMGSGKMSAPFYRADFERARKIGAGTFAAWEVQ